MNLRALFWCLALSLFAVHLCAHPPLIATGWDSPTPAEFRQHLTEFEKWGVFEDFTCANSAGAAPPNGFTWQAADDSHGKFACIQDRLVISGGEEAVSGFIAGTKSGTTLAAPFG